MTGSRQTGKSTLVTESRRRAAPYLTLDNLETLERARQEPEALVRSAERMTLDEVQRSPDLLLAVKRAVDEQKAPGRFLLTGSANLLLMQRISESLAGRAAYLTLWPITRREQLGAGAPEPGRACFETEDRSWRDLLAKPRAASPRTGALWPAGAAIPVPAHELADPEARALWFDGYTRTYLERDLQELSTVTSLVDFRRLMRAACLRLGGTWSSRRSSAGTSGSRSPPSTATWRSLETSYQLVRVPPYAVNRTKRLTEDAQALLVRHRARPPSGRRNGAAGRASGEPHPRPICWPGAIPWSPAPRSSTGAPPPGEEVDFVLEWQGRLLPIEVKATSQPRLADARGLHSFRAEYPDLARAALLLHAGTETDWIAEGVLATPWWKVI